MKLVSLDLPDASTVEDAVAQADLPEDVEVLDLMHGFKTWVNPINGFRVLWLHYSVDPKKRSPEWKANEKKKYGESEWNREMELMWEALDGRAVYADWWNSAFHVSKVSLGWNPKYPVLRGWDFGLNGACIFAQLFPHSRLFVLREAVSEDIGFERFAEEVGRLSLQWFPGATFIEFIDPSGRFRMGANERTYAQILTQKEVGAKTIISGAKDIAGRIKGVTDFLKEHVKGLPCYLIDPSCETLIKGYNGGYFYKFNKDGILKPEPEKNFFSHAHDANQYLCSKVRTVKLDLISRIGKIKEAAVGNRERPNEYARA